MINNGDSALNMRVMVFLRFLRDYWKQVMNLKNEEPTRCHLLLYCTSYRLNMFRALLCPSSGARDYDVDYHIGRFVLGVLYVGG